MNATVLMGYCNAKQRIMVNDCSWELEVYEPLSVFFENHNIYHLFDSPFAVWFSIEKMRNYTVLGEIDTFTIEVRMSKFSFDVTFLGMIQDVVRMSSIFEVSAGAWMKIWRLGKRGDIIDYMDYWWYLNMTWISLKCIEIEKAVRVMMIWWNRWLVVPVKEKMLFWMTSSETAIISTNNSSTTTNNTTATATTTAFRIDLLQL